MQKSDTRLAQKSLKVSGPLMGFSELAQEQEESGEVILVFQLRDRQHGLTFHRINKCDLVSIARE